MIILTWFLIVVGFTVPMSIFVLTPWWAPLWLVLGILIAHIFVFGVLIMTAPMFFKHSKLLSKSRTRFLRHAVSWLNKFIFNTFVKVQGLSNIPKSGATILYANHKSFVDPFVLMEVIPRAGGFSPKSTIYKVKIAAAWADCLHCLKVDRNNDRVTAQNMVKTIRDLKNGYLMSVFPEGTTKNRESEGMTDAKVGAYKLAFKSKATIVPVSLIGTLGTAKRMPFKRSKVTVIFHPPIEYEKYQNMTTSAVSDLVMGIVNKATN